MDKIADWYRNMSMKRAFLWMTMMTILLTILFSILVIAGLNHLRMNYYRGTGEDGVFQSITQDDEDVELIVIESEENDVFGSFLTFILFVSPLIVFLAIATLASILFYNLKVKLPIAQLHQGMEKIAGKDLDFKLDYSAKDELGQLCFGFETMRKELVKNNQKMWRIVEERQNLNKAFSHDVRTPMTIMKGHLQVLQQSVRKGKMEQSGVDMTIKLTLANLNKIENYIESMENASSIDTIEVYDQEVKLLDMWHEIKMSITSLEDQVEIIMVDKLLDADISITTDINMVIRIIENLVSNALRFAKTKVVIECVQSQAELMFRVVDDGDGFTAESKSKAFQPFYTSDRENRKGLGLYICKMLASSLAGDVQILDQNQGGIVCFRIPLHK